VSGRWAASSGPADGGKEEPIFQRATRLIGQELDAFTSVQPRGVTFKHEVDRYRDLNTQEVIYESAGTERIQLS